MNTVFQSDRADTLQADMTIPEVLEFAGLATPAARGLAGVIRHPLGACYGTMVVEEHLAGELDEFEIVRLTMAAGLGTVCIKKGEDADGSGELFVVHLGDNESWIGYCRVFAPSMAEQAVLVPVLAQHDFHFAMDADGRLAKREGRPATRHPFGFRIAAARLGRALAAEDEARALSAAA